MMIGFIIWNMVVESLGGSGYNFALCGFALAMQLLVSDFPKMTFDTWSGNWLISYLIMSNIELFDDTISVFRIVFSNKSFDAGRIKDGHICFG